MGQHCKCPVVPGLLLLHQTRREVVVHGHLGLTDSVLGALVEGLFRPGIGDHGRQAGPLEPGLDRLDVEDGVVVVAGRFLELLFPEECVARLLVR